jgi:hypothetical protein
VPHYRINPDVIETELPDELILLDPATREMFSLNATGRVAWRALAEGEGRSGAIARLARAFAVDEPTAGADVDALLARLASAGLVVADGDALPRSAGTGGGDAVR